ncbi:hypothetical protein LZL87_002016 [Fusarium oxysporum]|nr:hypothetical protein LZL87_002016 [Fusarium oxysporum]
MAKTNEDLLRRPLYLYDLPAEVLDTLVLKSDTNAESEAIAAAEATKTSSSESASSSDSNLVGTQACSLCGLTFTTVIDQRGHLKSDFHHYNLKQKLRGQKPVSEAEFEKLVGNLDESLSGSDSDESEEEEEDGRQDSTLTALLKKQARLADKANDSTGDDEDETAGKPGRGKPPLVWFSSPLLPEKTYFGMYRAILTGEEQRNQDLVEVLKKKQVEPISMPKIPKEGALPEIAYKGPHIFLCMIGGGHFAAMVVSLAPRPNKNGTTMNREATVLAHKTFHRYTTRRKQGGSQSANDNAKGAAHSAGSSLRRYNEQALVEDVRTLLQDWKALIDTSELLFIRATGVTNRRTLFGPYEGQVLKHNDTRLRGFPFSTRRATQNELMRSFIELTRLKVREIEPVQEQKKDSGSATPTKTSTKPSKPKLTEEEETALLHTSQLQAFVRRSKVPALLSYLKNNNISADFEFQPVEQNHHAPRPLHLAAAQNAAPLVLGLLVRGGADPTIKNNDGKTPFELAGERSTRDAFRVARSELGESKWSWDDAKVPPAMTKAEADKRDEREKKEASDKEAERRRAEEERLQVEGPKVSEGRKQKGNALAAGLKKTPQERREAEERGLTPEMRMRLERERRARAAEERLRRMQGGGLMAISSILLWGYHSIEVDDKLNHRDQIVDKLGQGGYSTIWLARDQELNKYVTIKVGTADQVSEEIYILFRLAENPSKEFSGRLTTPVLDQFTVNGPNCTHSCIVTAPAKCSVAKSIKTSRYISFRLDVARALSAQLIMATEYVHRAGFVHGDIHLRNVLLQLPGFEIDKLSIQQVYEKYYKPEAYPVTRNDGQPVASASVPKNVYTPNWLGKPSDEVLLPEAKLWLADFGTAFKPSQETRLMSYTHLQNRPPEAKFDPTQPLMFSSDIWSLGLMVWEVMGDGSFMNSFIFNWDEVIADQVDALGLLPQEWWEKWEAKLNEFEEDGQPKGQQEYWSLEKRFHMNMQDLRMEEGTEQMDHDEIHAFLDMIKGCYASDQKSV